jgi:hypothetical protein
MKITLSIHGCGAADPALRESGAVGEAAREGGGGVRLVARRGGGSGFGVEGKRREAAARRGRIAAVRSAGESQL